MISIHHLYKRFGKKEILHDIHLDLEDCTYGLLGPNGSGKTTLMRCIAGIYSYDGQILPEGKPAGKGNRVSDSLGYLPQTFTMYRELTVYEAMDYMKTIKHLSGNQKEHIMDCLRKVNLEDRASAKVRTLSGGMLRRLGIAQALLGAPRVTIVDEPTAGLDPEERMRFKNIVRGIHHNGVFIISTHILEDVEAVCDKIIVLNEGTVLGVFTPEELANVPAGKVFDTEESLVPESAQILRVYEKSGRNHVRFLCDHAPEDLLPVEPSLEDGYIYLIKNFSPSGR